MSNVKDEELREDEVDTSQDQQPDTQPEAGESELTELEKLQNDFAGLNEKYLRTLAEYDNFRKRSIKEREAIYPEAKAAALTAFLPVLDTFLRAMQAPCSDAEFKKGVEMIFKSFMETLEKQGVEEFGEAGDTFDPNLHYAVAHADDEEAGENTICEVFQRGYKLGDKVLRYAMVKVAN